MLVLRNACHVHRESAMCWTRYAAACQLVDNDGEAVLALKQALWLRERDGDARRAHVTRGLLETAQARAAA
jgi:hypothetical protein